MVFGSFGFHVSCCLVLCFYWYLVRVILFGNSGLFVWFCRFCWAIFAWFIFDVAFFWFSVDVLRLVGCSCWVLLYVVGGCSGVLLFFVVPGCFFFRLFEFFFIVVGFILLVSYFSCSVFCLCFFVLSGVWRRIVFDVLVGLSLAFSFYLIFVLLVVVCLFVAICVLLWVCFFVVVVC